MYTTWLVEWEKKTGEFTYSGVKTEVADAFDVVYMDSIGDGKDSFQFKVVNTLLADGTNKYDNYFNVGDKVYISRKIDSDTVSSATDLVATCIITDIPLKRTSNSETIEIKGANFTESISNAITFVKSALPLDQYLKQGLAYVNSLNANLNITWHPDNPTTMTDNVTPFPTISERWVYKNFTRMLEKFSKKEYTKDVDYYYYIDKNNHFVWLPRLDNTDGTFDSDTDVYSDISISKDISGVVNFVMVRSQTTPAGWLTTKRVDDAVSRSKNGFKYKLITSDAVKQLLEEDGVIENDDDGYPSDFSTPYTTAWISSVAVTANPTKGIPAMTLNNPVTCSSKKEYNYALWYEAKARMATEGLSLIAERKNGKLLLKVTFYPSNDVYALGSVKAVTLDDIGFNGKPMRVIKRQISTTTDSITLSEDIGTVGDI